MHYCIAVITDKFPSDEVLEEKLAPFSEDEFYTKYRYAKEIPEDVYPPFTWDWWQVGGRYHGLLKLKAEDEDEEYNWKFYAKEPRAGRLYRSKMLETNFNDWKNREEDVYGYLGLYDSYIRVDGCKIKDVIDFEETILNHGFGFIGKDGQAFSREHWNGHNFIKDDQYEQKVKDAIKDIDDCYVCYIDIHD